MSEILIFLAIVVGVVVFIRILISIGTFVRSLKFKGKKLPVVVPRIDRVIQQRGMAMLYFCASGVPLCKQMNPIVNRINDEYKCVVRIDPFKDKKIASMFHIVNVPAVVMIDKNRVVRVYTSGFKNYPWLVSKIEKLMKK